HDLGADRCSLDQAFRCFRERVQELSYALPVPQCLCLIIGPYPVGRSAMPLRCFPSVAAMLPVIGEERRTLAELPRLGLLDRARNCGMDADSPIRELRAIGDFLGQWVLEGVLCLRIERLLVEELGVPQRMKSGR